METVTISREEFERMKNQLKILKRIEKIDLDLVRQFKNSLEDVKVGRIRRVA